MTDLYRALGEIRAIRRQVAHTTEFRGWGPLTLGSTAGLALVAGLCQARWVAEPAAHPAQYVALWLGTGVVSAGAIVTQMRMRARRLHTGMADEMIRMAVARFLPAAAAGVAVPFVLLRVAPGAVWMVPGLWQIFFSLGVFASCAGLPRRMLLAGLWFLGTGLAAVGLGDGRALAPGVMAGAYGVGMMLVAWLHALGARRMGEDDGEAG